MRLIHLSAQKSTIVDDCDFARLSAYRWYCVSGYAVRKVTGANGRLTWERMARAITDAPSGMCVDHINGDKLDNRRSNLRICTRGQNARNTKKPSHGKTSTFKGVSWYRRYSKYQAAVSSNGKRVHLGYYDRAEDAARAYDEAALKAYGEFALINGTGAPQPQPAQAVNWNS